MRQPQPLILACSLGLSLLITGCNKNDHDQPVVNKTSITVSPSLGQITNAQIVLRNASDNEIVQSTPLVNGKATFGGIVVGASLIAEVRPLDGANQLSYFDEGTHQTVVISGANLTSFSLRAAIPSVSANQSIGVTAFTEAATARALAGGSAGNIVSRIQAANAAINKQIKALMPTSVSVDVLQAPTLVGSDSAYSSIKNDKAGQYAALLAVLATASKSKDSTTPALTFMRSLANDFVDGTVDGLANGTATTIAVNSTEFLAAKGQAVLKLQQSFKTSASVFATLVDNLSLNGGIATNGYFGDLTVVDSSGTSTLTASTAARLDSGDIATVTWSDNTVNDRAILIVSFNNKTNQVLSVSGSNSTDSYLCVSSGCGSNLVTINPASNTLVFDKLVLTNSAQASDKVTISGALSYNDLPIQGQVSFTAGGSLSAAQLSSLMGSYSGSGTLITNNNGKVTTSNNNSCSADISTTGDMTVSMGSFSLTVAPSSQSIFSNAAITVNGKTINVLSVSLLEVGTGGVGTITASFSSSGTLYQLTGSKTTLTNQTVNSTTLSCNIQ